MTMKSKIRGGDHSNAPEFFNLDFGGGPQFMRHPDRGCAPTNGVNPDVWFDEKTQERAKRLCLQCPVRVQCRSWAAEHREGWGIWGGISRKMANRMPEDDT